MYNIYIEGYVYHDGCLDPIEQLTQKFKFC